MPADDSGDLIVGIIVPLSILLFLMLLLMGICKKKRRNKTEFQSKRPDITTKYNPQILKYIIDNKLITKEQFWESHIGDEPLMTPFVIACETCNGSVKIILESEFMDNEK